jgi:hypothetical protein
MAAFIPFFQKKATEVSNESGAKNGPASAIKPPTSAALNAGSNGAAAGGNKAKSIECEPPPCWNPCDTKCKIRYQMRPFHPADPCEGDDSLTYAFKMLGFAVAAMAFVYSLYAVSTDVDIWLTGL